MLQHIPLNRNYIFNTPTNAHIQLNIYIYIYIYILFIKCLLTVLVHPGGEILTHAQNYIYIYMVIVMLLHWLTSIKYIICGFYNAIYNY